MRVRIGMCVSIIGLLFTSQNSMAKTQPIYEGFGGQHGDNVKVEIYFSGQCLERVFMMVKVWQAAGDVSIEPHRQAVQASRQKVLARCPNVKTIDTDTRIIHVTQGRTIGTLYHTMNSTNEWRLSESDSVSFSGGAIGGEESLAGRLQVSRDGVISGVFQGTAINMKAQFRGTYVLVKPYDANAGYTVSYRASGTWREAEGSHQQQKCDKPHDGSALWGGFEIVTTSPGGPKLIITSCPEDASRGRRTEYIMVFAGDGLTTYDQSDQFRQLFRPAIGTVVTADEARIAWEKENPGKFTPLYEIVWDSSSALSYLGYSRSKYLFTDNSIKYYVAEDEAGVYEYAAQDYRNKKAVFVAVHDVGDDDPIIDIKLYSHPVTAFDDEDDIRKMRVEDIYEMKVAQDRPTYNLTEQAISYYGDTISKKLKAAVPDVQPGFIAHYTKSTVLFNAQEMLRRKSKKPKFVIAPIITHLVEKSDAQNQRTVWRPTYESINLSHLAKGQEGFAAGEGNTINVALADRKRWDSEWAKYARWIGLTLVQRKVEITKKRQAVDDKKRAEAKTLGLLYEDWGYWSQFHNAHDLKAIFDGRSRGGDLASTNIFSHIYLRYQAWYYAKCRKNVPDGSPGIKYTEITHYQQGGWGGVSYDIERSAGEVHVRQKMWPKFQYHNNTARVALPATDMSSLKAYSNNPTSLFRELGDTAKFLTDVKEDMDRLYEHTCDSAFLKQFDENLYRIAEGGSTLQEQVRSR